MCFTTIFYVRLYFSNITIWLLSNDSSVRTSNLSKNIIILIQHRKIVQIAPTNSLCWPLLIFATFYIYLWESFKCYKSFRIFPRKVVFFKKKYGEIFCDHQLKVFPLFTFTWYSWPKSECIIVYIIVKCFSLLFHSTKTSRLNIPTDYLFQLVIMYLDIFAARRW